MSHFAEIDNNGMVKRVIVAEQDFIDSGLVGNPKNWVQTSYNTKGGVHYGQDGKPDGKPQMRKNYAGIGYKYDLQRDAFIPPKPFPSWVFDEETCLYKAPVPPPSDGKEHGWDELSGNWII